MDIRDLTIYDVKDYLRVTYDDDDFLIDIMMRAARCYIRSYTGLTDDEIAKHESLYIAYLCLISDMYDNRSATVQSDKKNPTVEAILNMYSKNLL